jgi:hypothetical protein
MATRKSQIKASNRYNKANTKSICIRLNIKTDSKIIDRLESVDSKSGYIKRLILEDMGYCSMRKEENRK